MLLLRLASAYDRNSAHMSLRDRFLDRDDDVTMVVQRIFSWELTLLG